MCDWHRLWSLNLFPLSRYQQRPVRTITRRRPTCSYGTVRPRCCPTARSDSAATLHADAVTSRSVGRQQLPKTWPAFPGARRARSGNSVWPPRTRSRGYWTPSRTTRTPRRRRCASDICRTRRSPSRFRPRSTCSLPRPLNTALYSCTTCKLNKKINFVLRLNGLAERQITRLYRSLDNIRCNYSSTGRLRFSCAIGLCCPWPRQWIKVYAAFLHSNLLQL